jgi:hypothetical protein
MVFELKKKLQFLLGLWSLPLVSLSLAFLGAFYKVWQGFTKKKKDAHANDSQKEKQLLAHTLLDQDCRTNKSNNQ